VTKFKEKTYMFFTAQSNLGGNAAKTKVRSWKKLLGGGKKHSEDSGQGNS